jgi:hypothetical protein
MQVHLTSMQQWREHCERLAQLWAVDLTRNEVRLYKNIHQAINEAMLGLRRLYSFKKKIFFFPDQVPHTETPLKSLAKEGLQLEALPFDTLKNTAEFIAKIDKEGLFIVYAVDDPVLATFEDVSGFEQALAEQNIIKVRVSYGRHFHDGIPTNIERNTVHILGMPDGSAVALLGERTRYAPQGVELLDWSDFDVQNFTKKLPAAAEYEKSKSTVDAFESRSDLGFRPLIAPATHRLYDRAIVVWDDLDSAAMLESLRERFGGADTFESLSLSRWGGTKGFQWLEAKGFAKNLLRGALVIDARAINDDLVKSIRDCRQQILEAQSGD